MENLNIIRVVCPHCREEVSFDWDADVQSGRLSLDWMTDIRFGRTVCQNCHQSISIHWMFSKENGDNLILSVLNNTHAQEPPTEEPPVRYYACAEIADIMKVSRQSVWLWVKKRKLKAVFHNHEYRVPEQELERFIQQVRPLPG